MFEEGHYKPPAWEDFVSSFPMGLGKPWYALVKGLWITFGISHGQYASDFASLIT